MDEKKPRKVVISQFDDCRLEKFDPRFHPKSELHREVVGHLRVTQMSIEERYKLLVQAVINLAIRKGAFLDDDALLVLKGHGMAISFPVLSGDAWETWFLNVMSKTYEHVIEQLADHELKPSTLVTYVPKNSSFFAFIEEEPVTA